MLLRFNSSEAKNKTWWAAVFTTGFLFQVIIFFQVQMWVFLMLSDILVQRFPSSDPQLGSQMWSVLQPQMARQEESDKSIRVTNKFTETTVLHELKNNRGNLSVSLTPELQHSSAFHSIPPHWQNRNCKRMSFERSIPTHAQWVLFHFANVSHNFREMLHRERTVNSTVSFF